MKAGNLEACDIPLRDKVIYEGYMQMNPKYKTPFVNVPAKSSEESPIKGRKNSDNKTDAESQKDDDQTHGHDGVELQKFNQIEKQSTQKEDQEN